MSVSARRAQAAREAKARAKRGEKLEPVLIEGRAIATTFWGRAWCENLERYSDLANRLPRGRTYARNGSVLDLRVAPGEVTALVQGSSLYRVRIGIRALGTSHWKSVVAGCSGRIGSLVELLRGRISDEVMRVVTEPTRGLFPVPKEIELSCSCPDSASMCKHVAAALYGVGARLDTRPELLFTLRGTDPGDLVTDAAAGGALARAAETRGTLTGGSLSELFGVEIEERLDEPARNSSMPAAPTAPATRRATPKTTKRRSPRKSR
jgi:uncharacterized Zn finger protein